jgi:hypothetical protein
MPIQRPSEQEQRPSALEVFTNRAELIAAFERNLAHKKPEEHRLLVFFGDGGIGKTTLLQKLEQLHRQRCPQALSGRLDLAGADTTPPDLCSTGCGGCFQRSPFPRSRWRWRNTGGAFIRSRCTAAIARSCCRGLGPMPMCSTLGLMSWRI